jgi:allantoin racemase
MSSTMKRKILLINPNTNQDATLSISEGIKKYISPRTKIECTNPTDGPQGIDTLLDISIAQIEVAKIVAKNRDNFDAFVIACGADPGLDVCRQITDKPVIGIAEAAMHFACFLGYKFSMIASLEEEIPLVQELVDHYGLTEKLSSIRCIKMSTAELEDREEMFTRLAEASKIAVEQDHAEVIVLSGSVMIGSEKKLSKRIGVPVVVGAIAAVKIAEILIDYGQATSKIYKYFTPKKYDQLMGYEELLNVYSK